MRIAIDAMGGDNAPDEIIEGVKESIKDLDKGDEIILVGQQDVIEAKLTPKWLRKHGDKLRIEHALSLIHI